MYRFYPELAPDQLEQFLMRGWRRFGMQIFRPNCPNCQQCVSLRVPVAEFTPSRSQRKVLQRNQRISWRVQTPTVTPDHVQLYNRWHAERTESRGWSVSHLNAAEYAESFLFGDFPSLREFLYFDGDELVGVGLVDVMPHSLSSAYVYYAPEWSPLSPGTYAALAEIEFARQTGRDYVYFGYWIEDCPSMAYKNRFRPHELLAGLPADDEAPVWRRTDTTSDPH